MTWKILFLYFCILIANIHSAGIIGRKQSVGAKGILKCNGVPMRNAKVKLYDVDSFDIDDFMAEVKTDNSGKYEIKGTHREITTIDPKLNFYHKCGSIVGLCSRKFSIKIPDSFVSDGTQVKKWYDAGTIELAGKFPGESKDCVN